MRVIATQKGYYGGIVREPGAAFVLGDPDTEFSARWMTKADAEAARDPLDHDGDGRKGGSKTKGHAKETEVKPPAEPAKGTDPVTGDEI